MRTHHHHLLRYRRIPARLLKLGGILLGFILVADILAVHFSTQIEAALTLPAPRNNSSAPAQLPASTPTWSVTAKNILAQDTFQRTDQNLWGTASDGQTWRADAMSSQSFMILNHMGQITNGNSIYDAILGPKSTNAEVVFSGSLSSFAGSSLGAIVRWTDANNLYKVYLDGTRLVLLKKAAGLITVLKTIAFPAQGGISYTFRFRAESTLLSAKVWPTDQAEPADWMIIVPDSSLSSGYGGIRIVIQNAATALITSFVESKL